MLRKPVKKLQICTDYRIFTVIAFRTCASMYLRPCKTLYGHGFELFFRAWPSLRTTSHHVIVWFMLMLVTRLSSLNLLSCNTFLVICYKFWRQKLGSHFWIEKWGPIFWPLWLYDKAMDFSNSNPINQNAFPVYDVIYVMRNFLFHILQCLRLQRKGWLPLLLFSFNLNRYAVGDTKFK